MFKNALRFPVAMGLLVAVFSLSSHGQSDKPAAPATQPATTGRDDSTLNGTETIVFLRHGEKPKHGLGQLTPQGLNRSLALAEVLPRKFGRPDYIFAPDPIEKVDGNPGYFYVRPLATIEPTAIALEMTVQTPFGYRQIDKLDAELSNPKYFRSTIFVAWEHGYEDSAAKNLVKRFGENPNEVPSWPENDYDSLFVIKIERKAGKPALTFTHDHEGLDHLSKVGGATEVTAGRGLPKADQS